MLEAATHAFWAKGYEATSMEDLLTATQLSKSSLYQAFGGKQALFRRCIAAYSDRMVAHLRQRLDASASPLAFIKSTLLEVAREGAANPEPMGCLVVVSSDQLQTLWSKTRKGQTRHWHHSRKRRSLAPPGPRIPALQPQKT